MNETCDRCGPAVRAVYRVDRHGELYLCRHCTNQLWAALSAQGWTIRPAREHALAAASQRILRRLVTATGLSRRANERQRPPRHRRPDRSIHHSRGAALTTRPGDLSTTRPTPNLRRKDITMTGPISRNRLLGSLKGAA